MIKKILAVLLVLVLLCSCTPVEEPSVSNNDPADVTDNGEPTKEPVEFPSQKGKESQEYYFYHPVDGDFIGSFEAEIEFTFNGVSATIDNVAIDIEEEKGYNIALEKQVDGNILHVKATIVEISSNEIMGAFEGYATAEASGNLSGFSKK